MPRNVGENSSHIWAVRSWSCIYNLGPKLGDPLESNNFLMWLFIIMWCGFFMMWCGFFMMSCGYLTMWFVHYDVVSSLCFVDFTSGMKL